MLFYFIFLENNIMSMRGTPLQVGNTYSSFCVGLIIRCKPLCMFLMSTGLEISNCNCPYFFLCRTLLNFFYLLECYLTPSLGQLNTLINYDLETCLGMIICLGARYLLNRIFEVVTPAMQCV